jgi:hypothetical protein
VLNDRSTGALDLGAKSGAKTHCAGFVVSRDAFDLRSGLGEKLQNKTHRSGAICRNLANTSPAGIGFDSPVL